MIIKRQPDDRLEPFLISEVELSNSRRGEFVRMLSGNMISISEAKEGSWKPSWDPM